jgi:hypothetical protein
LITPAGYAFIVWSVITARCVVSTVAVLRIGLVFYWETAVLAQASIVFVGFSVWLPVAAGVFATGLAAMLRGSPAYTAGALHSYVAMAASLHLGQIAHRSPTSCDDQTRGASRDELAIEPVPESYRRTPKMTAPQPKCPSR